MKRLLTLCIIHQRSRVLLGMKKRGFGAGRWNGFGGKVAPEETIEGAAKREMREELNVEIKNIKNIVPEFRTNPREAETQNKEGVMAHYYFLEYLCDFVGGKLKADDDLAEAKWVSKGELKEINLTPPSKEMYKELGWIK